MKTIGRLLWSAFGAFTLVSGNLFMIPQGACESSFSVSPDLEKVLLASDWRMVAETCGPADDLRSLPVQRIIKGHAHLMLNQNNESIRLFLESADKSDRESWRKWTEEFAARQPSSPVAFYLKGDALARLDELDAAIAAFKKSIKLAEQQQSSAHPAFNGLGVTYCAKRDWNKAHECFERAIALAPDFADAHANLGTWSLYQSQLKQASKAYENSLKISSDFALALTGNGCIDFLHGPKEWQAANDHFSMAGKELALPIVALNAELLNQAAFDTASKANLYFHDPIEFPDWNDTLKLIQDQSSFLNRYFQSVDLRRMNPKTIIDRFNEIMDEPTLYDDNKEIMDRMLQRSTNVSLRSGIMDLILETENVRSKKAGEMNVYERGAIRGLNRGLLSIIYPRLIRARVRTKAGMSLMLSGGIAVDGYKYKQGLTTSVLLDRKFQMEYTYKPLALGLQQIPIIGFMGKMWDQHLDRSLMQTNRILEKERGLRDISVKSGGLSTEELMVLFFRRDAWNALNWFGLAYNISSEAS